MKKINKKLLFSILGASAGLGLVASIAAACATQNKQDASNNKDNNQTSSQSEANTQSLTDDSYTFGIDSAQDISELYATQFTKDNLLLKINGNEKPFAITKEGNEYSFKNFNLKVLDFIANKQEGTIVVKYQIGNEHEKSKIIEGFKKQKKLSEITSFEENTKISSKFNLESYKEFEDKKTLYATSLKEEDIKASLLIDDQEILNDKFDVKVVINNKNDETGTINVAVSISFKNADENDKSKTISNIFKIEGFQQKTIEKLDQELLERLTLVLKLDNRKSKLPREIDAKKQEYFELKLKESKEENANLVDFDNSKYEWKFSTSHADDDRGVYSVYVTFRFKDNNNLDSRTKELSFVFDGFKKVSEVEVEKTIYSENEAWDYNYEVANPKLPTSLQNANLKPEDLILWYTPSSTRRRQYYIDEFYKNIYTDTSGIAAFNSSYDYPRLLKNYQKYFRDNLTNEQKSNLTLVWSSMTKDEEKEQYGTDPINFWLNMMMLHMPIQVGWHNDPKKVDNTFNATGTSTSGSIEGTNDASTTKNNVDLYNEKKLIQIPTYRYIIEKVSDDNTKSEKQLLNEWAEAKKALDADANNQEKITAYNQALEAVKEKFEISDTFVYDANVEYLVGYHKYNEFTKNRKPRLVIRSAVIQKWEQDHKPILITTNGIALKKVGNAYPDLKYLIPQYNSNKVYYERLSYSELSANSVKLSVQLSDPTTLVENQKLYLEYAKYESAEATTSIKGSTKTIEVEYNASGLYEVVLNDLEPNSFYRLTQIGYKNGTKSTYTNKKDSSTKEVDNLFVLNGKNQDHKILISTPAANN